MSNYFLNSRYYYNSKYLISQKKNIPILLSIIVNLKIKQKLGFVKILLLLIILYLITMQLPSIKKFFIKRNNKLILYNLYVILRGINKNILLTKLVYIFFFMLSNFHGFDMQTLLLKKMYYKKKLYCITFTLSDLLRFIDISFLNKILDEKLLIFYRDLNITFTFCFNNFSISYMFFIRRQLFNYLRFLNFPCSIT